jgi:hypothetical protein
MNKIEKEIERLVKIVSELIKQNNLSINLMNNQLKFSRDKDNVWRKISCKFYGSDESKYVLKIYKWWSGNYYNIRSKVLELLDEDEMEFESGNISLELDFDQIFYIDNEEWLNLYKKHSSLVSSTGRRRFKIEFDFYMNNC